MQVLARDDRRRAEFCERGVVGGGGWVARPAGLDCGSRLVPLSGVECRLAIGADRGHYSEPFGICDDGATVAWAL
jgi:hypothetical protein